MEYWSGTDAALRSDQLVLKPYGEVSLNSTSPNAATGQSSLPAPLSPPRALATTTTPPVSTTAPAPAIQPPIVAIPVTAIKTTAPASAVSAASDVSASPDNAPSAPSDFTWQGPSQAKVGDKISVTFDAQSLQGVKALNLHAGFDPSVLKVVDVIEGNAMKQSNSSSTLSKVIDQAGGDISVDLTGSGSNKGGSVFTLMFEVVAPAQETTVTINSISGNLGNGDAYSPAVPATFALTIAQ